MVARVMDFRGTYKGGGGPDKTILNSAARHDSSKVYVLVSYLRQPDDDEFQIGAMANALGIHYVENIDRFLIDWKCLLHLRSIIKKEKITLIHSHDDKTLLYSVILKHLVTGLRIMHTCHSHADYGRDSFKSIFNYLNFRIRKKILVWLMARHLPPILTVSQNTRQRLIDSGLKPNNVSVLYNGIDIDFWKRSNGRPLLRQELGLTHRQFLVGTVARITYDKDLPTFFEVAKRVHARMPDVKFVIVGDGYGNELQEAKNELKTRAQDDYIYFTGHRNDLLDVYTSFDVFLMTSRTEGLPNTVLEAMSLELPVVSTAVGGVPELVIDKEVGLLAPVGDSQTLANHVCQLLQEEVLRSQMCKKSRAHIEEQFNFSRRIASLENIYLDFVRQGKSEHF